MPRHDHHPVAAELVFGDWRDADTAIARVGPWLAERDLALQVAISVAVFEAY